MKWLVRIAALYIVVLMIVLAAVAFTRSPAGPGAPSHERMNPVSHNDYELHRSIGHVT